MTESLKSCRLVTDLKSRWLEGAWGMNPSLSVRHAPSHVTEALYLTWEPFLAIRRRILVTGTTTTWFQRIERRKVLGPTWFLNGRMTWYEYRALFST